MPDVAIVERQAPTHLEVRVAYWRYSRHVIVRDDDEVVEMEIARTHCSHCPTCRGRIAHCERALADTQFERRSAGGGEYFVLPLPADVGRDALSIAQFLGEQFNLPIEA